MNVTRCASMRSRAYVRVPLRHQHHPHACGAGDGEGVLQAGDVGHGRRHQDGVARPPARAPRSSGVPWWPDRRGCAAPPWARRWSPSCAAPRPGRRGGPCRRRRCVPVPALPISEGTSSRSTTSGAPMRSMMASRSVGPAWWCTGTATAPSRQQARYRASVSQRLAADQATVSPRCDAAGRRIDPASRAGGLRRVRRRSDRCPGRPVDHSMPGSTPGVRQVVERLGAAGPVGVVPGRGQPGHGATAAGHGPAQPFRARTINVNRSVTTGSPVASRQSTSRT